MCVFLCFCFIFCMGATEFYCSDLLSMVYMWSCRDMQNNQLTSISGSISLPPNVTLWYASNLILLVYRESHDLRFKLHEPIWISKSKIHIMWWIANDFESRCTRMNWCHSVSWIWFTWFNFINPDSLFLFFFTNYHQNWKFKLA